MRSPRILRSKAGKTASGPAIARPAGVVRSSASVNNTEPTSISWPAGDDKGQILWRRFPIGDLAIYLTPPTTTGCGLFRELDTSFPFLVSFVVKEINFT
jgi:hypothetical protein